MGWGWYYDSNPNIVRTVLVNNQELNLGSTLGTTMGTIDIPLLEMESFICDSGFVKLEVVPTDWADCEEIGWFPTDPITLRIIQGDEFASFFNIRTGTDLGNTALIDPFVRIEDLHFFFGPSWDQDGLDDIVIVSKDSNYTLPFTVIVEANINEVTFSNEIEFVPKSFIIETELYPPEITSGEQSSLNINITSICSGLPFETKINVEIIKGQEYGSLIDPYTNEKTKTITNLEHWFGSAWVDYIADSISAVATDSVIFRVTTTDPEIVPKEAILIIKPPPIYVYTMPDVLGADDTADVIIKHRLEDGTLEDFTPEQTFELAALDGCVNGNFLVDTTINVYFADALQPIKFVTADSLDEQFDKVLIRVGTELGGSGGSSKPVGNIKGEEDKVTPEKQKRLDTLRAGFEKMIAEKKVEAEAKKKENNEPPIEAPIVTACALNNSIYSKFWQGFASLGDECENLNTCIGVPYPEFVQYKMVPGGLSNNNPIVCEANKIDPQTGLLTIQTGGFIALDWRFERSQRINAEPCFNNQSNEVRFNMILTDVETNQNSPILKPEALLEICEDNISNAGLILISSTNQLLNLIRQFPEQIPLIKSDMDSSLSRYGASIVQYKFRQEISSHESEHKIDYEHYLDSLKIDWLDGKIADYTVTCSQFESNPYASEEAKVKYLSIVKEYIEISNRETSRRTNEFELHKRLSIQASLFEYFNILYKFENGIIF